MSVSYSNTTCRSQDGTALHLQRWTPQGPSSEVLIIHGYAEHGGRYRELAHQLSHFGAATTTIDLRGHGRSQGQRGYVRKYSEYHLDVAAAVATLSPDLPHFILAHSNGAVVALDFITQHAPPLDGLILSSPFLGLAQPPPRYKLAICRLASKVMDRLPLPNGIDASGLCDDPAMVASYQRDPLIFCIATAGWFREVQAAQQRVLDILSLPRTLLFIYGDADPFASPSANAAYAERLGSGDKTVVAVPGGLHEVLNQNRSITLSPAK
ncbi:MAG: alpha/beta hydrolase [Myxococcota bacterium]